MKASEDLFDLIRSLNKSEKGYFKKYVSAGNDKKSNYLRLFEAIEQQDEYDEAIIKEKFKKEAFVKQLTVAKHYLHQLIRKSLRSYYGDISIRAQLNDLMRDVEIFYTKGLYEQCEKLVERAKKMAILYEKYAELTTILYWEDEVISIQARSGNKISKNIHEINNERISAAKKLISIIKYRFLSKQLASNLVKHGFDKVFLNKIRKDFLNHPMLKTEIPTNSFDERMVFYDCHIIYLFYTQDFEKAYTYAYKAVNLYESQPHRIEEYPMKYITALRNFFICLYYLQKPDEMYGVIKKMRDTKGKTEKNNMDITCFANHDELLFYKNSCQFDKAITYLSQTGKKDLYFSTKEMRILWHYTSALIYFISGNYKKAKSNLNEVINEPNKELRLDIQCDARILNIIAYYEMGEAVLLSHVIRNTYRFLYKHRKLYPLSEIILSFIRRNINQIQNQKQLMVALKELKARIEREQKNGENKNKYVEFDLGTWLESKIENRPYADMIIEKAGLSG